MARRLRSTIALAIVVAAAAAIVVAMPASAAPTAGSGPAATSAKALDVFPTEIALPNGFLPEGIAIGSAPYAFFGSRADGDIFRVNLVTGEGTVISQGPGTPSVGVKVDHRFRLFVAGGPGGNGRVVDTITGEILASYTFTTAPSFVNDVALTPDAAWFTDSLRPFLYKVPLGRAGSLPDQSDVVQVPLGGDYVHMAGFNLNGIARTPDGDALLVIQSSTGMLFRVEPSTGDATTVDLGGTLLNNGDGLLLDGRTLFVVQNALNRVAVVELNKEGTAGEVTEFLTDPRFDIPTTVAEFGNRLYLPNARFTTPPTPDTTYNAVAIPKP
jgi:sugar lactone lactonase YvrE